MRYLHEHRQHTPISDSLTDIESHTVTADLNNVMGFQITQNSKTFSVVLKMMHSLVIPIVRCKVSV